MNRTARKLVAAAFGALVLASCQPPDDRIVLICGNASYKDQKPIKEELYIRLYYLKPNWLLSRYELQFEEPLSESGDFCFRAKLSTDYDLEVAERDSPYGRGGLHIKRTDDEIKFLNQTVLIQAERKD